MVHGPQVIPGGPTAGPAGAALLSVGPAGTDPGGMGAGGAGRSLGDEDGGAGIPGGGGKGFWAGAAARDGPGLHAGIALEGVDWEKDAGAVKRSMPGEAMGSPRARGSRSGEPYSPYCAHAAVALSATTTMEPTMRRNLISSRLLSCKARLENAPRAPTEGRFAVAPAFCSCRLCGSLSMQRSEMCVIARSLDLIVALGDGDFIKRSRGADFRGLVAGQSMPSLCYAKGRTRTRHGIPA